MVTILALFFLNVHLIIGDNLMKRRMKAKSIKAMLDTINMLASERFSELDGILLSIERYRYQILLKKYRAKGLVK